MKRTQCSLMLELLADGRWHSNAELYSVALTSRPNSRASDLRDDHGFDVRHEVQTPDGRRVDGYRLTAVPAGRAAIEGTLSELAQRQIAELRLRNGGGTPAPAPSCHQRSSFRSGVERDYESAPAPLGAPAGSGAAGLHPAPGAMSLLDAPVSADLGLLRVEREQLEEHLASLALHEDMPAGDEQALVVRARLREIDEQLLGRAAA